jgi:two-component system, cell cycle sensor histidine kinase and response regulator CckA
VRLCAQHVGPIHLLLTGAVMPGMSGPALARRLEAMRRAMQVICMSGYTEDAIVHHDLLALGRVYLPKPFTAVRIMRESLDTSLSDPPDRS